MLSFTGTAVLTTGEQKVTKSISALIVSSTNTPETFTTENITIWIERVNLDNVQIATAIPLINFMMLSSFGSATIQSDATQPTICLCDLAPDGAIRLTEGESLKYRIDGLQTAKTYTVNTIEDAMSTEEFYKFERKTFATEDLVKTTNVESAELGVFNLHSSITQVSLRFANGTTIKYLPFELRVISRDIDPIFAIDNLGVVAQGQTKLICLPLLGVSEVEIVKTAGTLIELITMSTKHLND